MLQRLHCLFPINSFFFVDEGCIRRISLQAAKRFDADPEKRKSYDKYGEADMADFNMEEFMEQMFADDGMFGHRTLLPPSARLPARPALPALSLSRSLARTSRSVLGSPQFCGHASRRRCPCFVAQQTTPTRRARNADCCGRYGSGCNIRRSVATAADMFSTMMSELGGFGAPQARRLRALATGPPVASPCVPIHLPANETERQCSARCRTSESSLAATLTGRG